MSGNHSISQARQDTPGVAGNKQLATRLAGEQPEDAALNRPEPKPLEPLIDTGQVTDNVDHRFPAVHPTFGRGEWGVQESGHYGDFSVGHGYYGAFSQSGDTIVNLDSERILVPSSTVLWTSDQETVEEAAILWQHRDDVEQALLGVGYGGSKKVRVRALVDDYTIAISNYDQPDRFEPIVIPRRG